MTLFQLDYHSKPELYHAGYVMNCRKYEIYIPDRGTYVFCSTEFVQKCSELYTTGEIYI